MSKARKRKRHSMRERGAAMIFALALTLCLTMLVAAIQMETVTLFKVSRTERDFERALQMAEAGLNAYQHRLTFGPATGDPNAGLLPPLYQFPEGAAPTIEEFKTGVRNGTYTLIRYPAGSQQGYFAGTIGVPGDTARIVSYGWSNGVVRRVIAVANTATAPDDIDDDTEVRPTGAYAMFARSSMNVEMNTVLVGGIGTNGAITMGGNCEVRDGVVSLNGPDASFSGGQHTNPTVVTNPDPVVWPTVDQIADRLFPQGGLAWLAQNNDNAMATINGVAGIPNNRIDLKNKATIIFRGKPGGANYYLTDVQLKNNATIRFDNTAGPIRIWLGPSGGSGGFDSKNGTDFVSTSSDPANAPRLYMATKGGFTGKNNIDCNFGIYAINEGGGQRWGHIELKNNMTFSGTFVADSIALKNNAVLTAAAPYWQPLGGAYYDISVWEE